MKKKQTISSTSQQAFISFQVGNEMEKNAPLMINLSHLELSPEIPLVILSGYLVYKKEEMKNDMP